MPTYPRSRVPLGRTFSTPPSNMHKMAFFMYSCPWMEGASDLLSNSKISMFLLRASFLHFWTSSLVISSVDSLVSWDMLLAIRTVLKKQTKHCETVHKSANSGLHKRSNVLTSRATITHWWRDKILIEKSLVLTWRSLTLSARHGGSLSKWPYSDIKFVLEFHIVINRWQPCALTLVISLIGRLFNGWYTWMSL
jgi:hypothetical protein